MKKKNLQDLTLHAFKKHFGHKTFFAIEHKTLSHAVVQIKTGLSHYLLYRGKSGQSFRNTAKIHLKWRQ